MTKRDLIVSIVAGVFLGLIAISLGFNPQATNASAQADVEAIRISMLSSHNNWKSLRGEVTTTWFSNGQVQETRGTFALTSEGKANFQQIAFRGFPMGKTPLRLLTMTQPL